MLTASEDEFFAYYDPGSAATYLKALEDVRNYVEREGPFDAVMAFSQGASLAATYIADWRSSGQPQKSDADFNKSGSGAGPNPFNCAVFFSGGPPCDVAALRRGEVRYLDSVVVIDIPTVHVWGAKENVNKEDNIKLSKACNPKKMTILVHDGGHEPIGATKHNSMQLTKVVQAVLRASETYGTRG